MDPNDVAAQGVLALFAGLIVFAAIVGPIVYVIVSWFMMKLFEKAGVEGKWRAWVPIYREMIFLKLGDMSPWLFLYAFGATALLAWTGFGSIISLALMAVMAMAAWRVGLKLQKEAAWTVLYVLLGLVWHGILAFDSSRWNTNVPRAPWADNSFLADRTVWEGVPAQPSSGAPGYGAPQGYAAPPQGYPAGQGYGQPAQPYADPSQPYGAPAQPPAYGAPQPPAYGAPQPPTPPAAPGTPPTPPAAPDVPPAPGTDRTQPPA